MHDSSENNGKWISAACWHNCGGCCVNKIYVADGVPVRQKTDDTRADTPDNPQQRACAKGRAQIAHILGADRLKYPMKRKNWKPLSGGDKSLRGRDEWERISWDEAISYIAAELKHAKENYGNSSIVGTGSAFLNSKEWGGFTTLNDTSSFGSFAFVSTIIGLPQNGFNAAANCRMDLRRSETIIMVGSNPAWSSMGNPTYNFYQAKEAGAKFIYVGPTYNFSADIFEAKWIPVRPATDVMLFLAVAYTMITEDDRINNPIIDWDFLYKCTVGFDSTNMPKDAKLDENFHDYVLGKYDGIPKTPEWASEITGTPVEDIVYLARELRKEKRVALLWGMAPSRSNDAEDFPQIIMTVGAMGGHMGKPGHATGSAAHNASGNNGARLAVAGSQGVPDRPSIWGPGANPAGDSIMAPDLWDAVLTGKYRRSDAFRHHGIDGIDDREIDIRVIWHGGNHNILSTFLGTKKGIEAHRKVDFVMTRALSMNACAQYSDIVLPLTSMWERPGSIRFGNRDAIIFSQQVIERMYECKSDYEIDELIAKALNLKTAAKLYPMNEGMQLLNAIAGCQAKNEHGQMKTLVTLTQDDISAWCEKWQGTTNVTPQEGMITLKEFTEKGVYQVERHENDAHYHIHYEEFVNDPDSHPLTTTVSGKFEIYCQTKADMVNAMGRSTIKPYPTYRPVLNGYVQSFVDWKNKIKGDYPFCLTTPHCQKRVHTIFDNVPIMREAFTGSFYVNPADANEKGVKNGDVVIIYSKYAKTLSKVCLSERLMPGTVELLHGAWINIDKETGVDHAGADNYITAPVTTGVGVSGYNTQLVNFEKYDEITGENL